MSRSKRMALGLAALIGAYVLVIAVASAAAPPKKDAPAKKKAGKSKKKGAKAKKKAASTNTVEITDFAFAPDPVSIGADGGTITWHNNDSSWHSAVSDDGKFDTGRINQGKTGTWTLPAGNYTVPYHCGHPGHESMVGTVKVGNGGPAGAAKKKAKAKHGHKHKHKQKRKGKDKHGK